MKFLLTRSFDASALHRVTWADIAQFQKEMASTYVELLSRTEYIDDETMPVFRGLCDPPGAGCT